MTAEMTIVLLNYRRPANIPIILDSIRRQTIQPVVFLWNNGPDAIDAHGVDRYERAGENLGCMVRWKMAREANTPYVMSLDDDLCFARDDALADVVESLRAMDDPAGFFLHRDAVAGGTSPQPFIDLALDPPHAQTRHRFRPPPSMLAHAGTRRDAPPPGS